LLDGGLGNDSLTGGNGLDKFLLVANSGIDTITDFEDGKDLLILGNGLSFSQLTITQGIGRIRINFAATGQVIAVLRGVSADRINATDFGVL
jgi:Ca2+-binding RTX toxin-like protein